MWITSDTAIDRCQVCDRNPSLEQDYTAMLSLSDLDRKVISVALPEVNWLQDETPGNLRICVAIFDEPTDQSHPCFTAPNFTQFQILVSQTAGPDRMLGRGTPISSNLLRQPDSSVTSIAPGCRSPDRSRLL